MFLIAGATSGAGRFVVSELLRRDLPTRVLVRGAADAAHFANLGADVVRGDIRDADALTRACRETTTVISLVGRHFAETAEGLWGVDALGNEALIHAARDAGAKRFVLCRRYGPIATCRRCCWVRSGTRKKRWSSRECHT